MFSKTLPSWTFQNLKVTKLINVPAEIRKYWWEKSENLINVPGTTISDSRVDRGNLQTHGQTNRWKKWLYRQTDKKTDKISQLAENG